MLRSIFILGSSLISSVSFATASEKVSEYTSKARHNCSNVFQATDGISYSEDKCRGSRGFQLKVVYSDGREYLDLLGVSEYDISNLEVEDVTGGAFNTIGNTIEWRGCKQIVGDEKLIDPRVIIYRTIVVNHTDYTRPSNFLVAYSLRQGTIGVVKAHEVSNANEVIRQIADKSFSCQ